MVCLLKRLVNLNSAKCHKSLLFSNRAQAGGRPWDSLRIISHKASTVKSLETCETGSFLPAQTAPTKPTQSEAHGQEGLTTSTTHCNCLWAMFCQGCDSASIIHQFIHSRCWSSTSLCFCISFLWLTELCAYKPQYSVVKEQLSLRGILMFNGDKVAIPSPVCLGKGEKKKLI